MSGWDDYNDAIAEIREITGADLDEARELYAELRDQLGETPDHDDIVSAYGDAGGDSDSGTDIPWETDDYDDWAERFESGEFDDYGYEEYEGNVTYEG